MARKRKSNLPLKRIFRLSVVNYLKELGIVHYQKISDDNNAKREIYLFIKNDELKNALNKYNISSLKLSARSCAQGENEYGNNHRKVHAKRIS
ncbi:hypothetical protein [Lysinibacillus sp. TE18511]